MSDKVFYHEMKTPEIFKAENGWVTREYDISQDRFVWHVATTTAELRTLIEGWAKNVVDVFEARVEPDIDKAFRAHGHKGTVRARLR